MFQPISSGEAGGISSPPEIAPVDKDNPCPVRSQELLLALLGQDQGAMRRKWPLTGHRCVRWEDRSQLPWPPRPCPWC